MKSYIVTSPTGVSIAHGILALDEGQARARIHLLDDLGEGLYEVRRPTQFKRGESFGYDGEVNKALLEEIRPTEEEHIAAKKKADDAEELSIEQAVQAKQLLLTVIGQAETLEELEALVPEDESDEDILAAAEARATELESAQ